MTTCAPDYWTVITRIPSIGRAAIKRISTDATNVVPCVPGPLGNHVPLLDGDLERHAFSMLFERSPNSREKNDRKHALATTALAARRQERFHIDTDLSGGTQQQRDVSHGRGHAHVLRVQQKAVFIPNRCCFRNLFCNALQQRIRLNSAKLGQRFRKWVTEIAFRRPFGRGLAQLASL